MFKTLEQSIAIIKSTALNKSPNYYPYFFIVGAGVSVPEIPSSKEIIEKCKDKIKSNFPELYSQYEKETDSFSSNPMKYYSTWIELAYPNRIDRSNLFKKLNSDSKISSANLMLAQILDSKVFTNTVFTTNFDDSIKRALDLIGNKYHFSAENAMDNLVINTHTEDIQIVHVHGTYNFYDCANLEKEIDSIASQTGLMSSSRLLSTFLSDRAPIIIGYSGWENDVIMQCLKERLTYSTPLQYFWVCYDKKSYENLPNWIKNSESINFILPTEELDCEDNKSLFHEKDHHSTIDATRFLRKIALEFKVESPLIFHNPYSYYSKQIESLLPKNEDVLHLKHWAQRLKLLDKNSTPFDEAVEKLEKAFVDKDFKSATEIFSTLNSMNLSNSDVEFIYFSIIKEYIKDEDSVASFEDRYNFHVAAVDFLNAFLDQISDTNKLIYIFYLILYTKHEPKNIDQMLSLFKKVSDVSHRQERLLEVELTSLGMQSSFYKAPERKFLLQELVQRCPKENDEKAFVFLKFKALLDLCSLVDIDEAISYISLATELSNILNENQKIKLFIAKSELLHNVSDCKTRNEWKNELFNLLTDETVKLTSLQRLEIVSNLSQLGVEEIMDSYDEDNFKKVLVALLDANVDTLNCNYMLQYSLCCILMCDLTNDYQIKKIYCKKVFDLMNSFPHYCSKFLPFLFNATCFYLDIPCEFVCNNEKSKLLIEIYSNKHTRKVFLQLLPYMIDADWTKDCSEFHDIISTYKSQKEDIKKAYDFYFSGQHCIAEDLFFKASQSEIPYISNNAKTNLSFMIRREETTGNYTFFEIINSIDKLCEMDYMNILLYCKKHNLLNDEKYLEAQNALKSFTEDEIVSIKKCWENIPLVGEEESKLVMSILSEI